MLRLIRNLDSLLGRYPGWFLKDPILRLVRLEGLSGVSLRETLLRGKLLPLQHLVQDTLKIGLGVLVPHTETILLLKLLDHHTQLGLLG